MSILTILNPNNFNMMKKKNKAREVTLVITVNKSHLVAFQDLTVKSNL